MCRFFYETKSFMNLVFSAQVFIIGVSKIVYEKKKNLTRQH